MNSLISRSMARLYLRLNVPIITLLALLQRSPVVRWISQGDTFRSFDGVGGYVLKASIAAVSLGAVDTMAGATSYVLTASANSPLTVTQGSAITPVGFTVTNTINIGSWNIVGPIPAGMMFYAHENNTIMVNGMGGVLDATTPGQPDGYGNTTGGNSMTTPVLGGTPTTAGTYPIGMTAYEYGAKGGLVSPAFTYTVVVQASGPPPPTAPTFDNQPSSVMVSSGGTAVLTGSSSNAVSYQWMLNGTAVSGATTPRLVLTNVTSTMGPYTLVATNTGGSTSSTSASVTTSADPNFGHLANLSVKTDASNTHVVTLGFYNTGTTPEPVLVRASGPVLSNFGVSDFLPDPTLSIIASGTSVALATNDNWGTPSSNVAAVEAAEQTTFAFALPDPTSLDAALAINLPVGGYSVQVSGNGSATGQTLAEVYDNTAGTFSASSTRLINLSCLDSISGTENLTAGFYLHGNTARTVLVRASGPALTGFGVSNVMPDPEVTLVATGGTQNVTLGTNAGWGGDPQITTVSNAVHAFSLSNPQSKDSVIVMTLPPGGYTATAQSAGGNAGTVLLEIYEVP